MEDEKEILKRELAKPPRQDWIPTPAGVGTRMPTTDELLIELLEGGHDPSICHINGAWECMAYYTDEYDEEQELTVSGETPQKACLAMRQELKEAVARSESQD